MAITAGQGFLFHSTEATTPANATVISHTVFTHACSDSDLHVMRYVATDSAGAAPLVATWCG